MMSSESSRGGYASLPQEAQLVSTPQQAAISTSKPWRRNLIGLFVGLIFLYLSTRGIDFNQVWGLIRNSNIRWLPPMLLLFGATVGLRTLRWRAMFPPAVRPNQKLVFTAFTLGAMANNFLPGRLGDILRAGIVARQAPEVGMGLAVGTLILEKVLDGGVIVLMFGCLLSMVSLPAWLSRMGLIGALICCGVFLSLLALTWWTRHWSRQHQPATGARPFYGKLIASIKQTLSRVAAGLHTLRNWRELAWVTLLSALIWSCETFIIYCSFMAFHLALPLAAALTTLFLLVIGTMLPAAPGFIGTYQFFFVTALAVYQTPTEQAFALGIFLNSFVIVCTTLIGIIPLWGQWHRTLPTARSFPQRT